MTTSFGLEFDKPSFDTLVKTLLDKYQVNEILETGTYTGTGTTLSWAKTGLPVTTIECNTDCYMAARENLKDYPLVTCLHGYSLYRKDMEDFVQADNFQPPEGIALDIDEARKVEFYLWELRRGDAPENLLPRSLRPNQLVFLDSAGGVGWLEFQAVINSQVRPLLLVMDDVFHYKHYRSAKFLSDNGFDYHPFDRWGYCFLS